MIILLFVLVVGLTMLNLLADREAIPLDAKNRMFRPIAVGLNDGRWYVRIDLWVRGWRWTFG